MSQVASKFWDLIEENRESLWRFSLGLTSDPDDAADLMSDTVLAAQNSFKHLRSEQAFKSFLFTIAHRIHKRKSWRKRIFGRLEEAEHVAYQGKYESSHDLDLLLKALDELPEKQREAILLFEISGFSLEEIHNIQGDSLSAVKLRLLRGREALRTKLKDNKSVLVAHPLVPQTT